MNKESHENQEKRGKERRVEWHVLKPTHNIHTEHMFRLHDSMSLQKPGEVWRETGVKVSSLLRMLSRRSFCKKKKKKKKAGVLWVREKNASRCSAREEKSNSISSSSCSRQQYVFAISSRKRTGCRSSCEAETDCETTPLKERWELDVHRCETFTHTQQREVRDDS